MSDDQVRAVMAAVFFTVGAVVVAAGYGLGAALAALGSCAAAGLEVVAGLWERLGGGRS
jgi:hypothetical protein